MIFDILQSIKKNKQQINSILEIGVVKKTPALVVGKGMRVSVEIDNGIILDDIIVACCFGWAALPRKNDTVLCLFLNGDLEGPGFAIGWIPENISKNTVSTRFDIVSEGGVFVNQDIETTGSVRALQNIEAQQLALAPNVYGQPTRLPIKKLVLFDSVEKQNIEIETQDSLKSASEPQINPESEKNPRSNETQNTKEILDSVLECVDAISDLAKAMARPGAYSVTTPYGPGLTGPASFITSVTKLELKVQKLRLLKKGVKIG